MNRSKWKKLLASVTIVIPIAYCFRWIAIPPFSVRWGVVTALTMGAFQFLLGWLSIRDWGKDGENG